MNKIIGNIKFVLALMIIGVYFILATPLYPFIKVSEYKTKKIISYLVAALSWLLLKLMNVTVKWTGNIDKTKNYYIVSNHLSYVDILVICMRMPSVFVTSMEMKRTPVLGQITDLAGCLYVERRSRKNIKNEIKNIIDALKNGLNVTVFPESTSTNGEQVLPFKRSLYQSAIESQIEVLPMTLNYERMNGEKIHTENRDLIFWYADMTFADHLYKLCLEVKSLEVELKAHSPLKPNHDSATLRDMSYQIINNEYRPIEPKFHPEKHINKKVFLDESSTSSV